MHNRPEFGEAIFDRRASKGKAKTSRQFAKRACLLRLGILDILCFIQDDAKPIHLLQPLGITADQRVAGQHEIDCLELVNQCLSFQSITPLVDMGEERRGKACHLFRPVGDHRSGGDQQHRPR